MPLWGPGWIGEQNKPTDSERCDVSIGILASQPAFKGEGPFERTAGARTLARTLAALSGLNTSIAEVIVFVQERDEDMMSVAKRFTERVYGFDRKIGKGNAWLYLATAAKGSHILFLEDDFVCEYYCFCARASDAMNLHNNPKRQSDCCSLHSPTRQTLNERTHPKPCIDVSQ